ncbi:hypothetical protein CXG45_27480 [Pseudomonas plecoglossicida]|uniref:Uncharacterized protein n=1 Tax=Pseudomonas plecoglossicida TaxID=70775 RepID=A0ABX4TTK9_PSEDL|nr:hypothetical protein [Pseudomonas plecoglossicida]PLU86074.1 hypothetical protein CXG44_16920 [Pseudomonas plecoglossicida]PLU89545.1 hypothetical protein CXG45_27480 [Pseudomonas plecoglossicida]PLV00815.1 hypothetical protein CXG48_20905 [Pseudomonas plecoglossicida]PLV07523.1 hypothetical protein CXG47_27615 [Pseudomonas plecoglossicida]
MTYQPYRDITAQGMNVQVLMVMLSQIEKGPDSAIRVLPAVVFMAFAVEAYLNNIGAKRISYWDDLERLPWRKKVNILHEVAGQKPDWGGSHLQFAASLFTLRDKLAHGKPERVLGPVFPDADEAHEFSLRNRIDPPWFTTLNKAWVMKAKDQFTDLMGYLARMHGLHESDHLLGATGGYLRDDGK